MFEKLLSEIVVAQQLSGIELNLSLFSLSLAVHMFNVVVLRYDQIFKHLLLQHHFASLSVSL